MVEWIRNSQAHPDWAVRAGTRCRADAPFIIPTDGFIGYLWDDSFKAGHRHQGIDIFGGTEVGLTPVVATYPGYPTRLSNWRSSVIVRVPEDPLPKAYSAPHSPDLAILYPHGGSGRQFVHLAGIPARHV